MTLPRHSLLSLKDTSFFHIVTRCVRRSWLCGRDSYTGKDFSHRKAWVLERLRTLSGAFAIDLCAFAVLSNHLHLVIEVQKERALRWTPEEVMNRWSMIFGVPEHIQLAYMPGAPDVLKESAAKVIETWRTRLHDMSWYMRCLSENLARRANEEDGCNGRFWQGRFKSQALLDEAGLLTAMAYVDLNPVRAGIAPTPEESQYTSIYQRIRAYKEQEEGAVPVQPFRDDLSVPGPRLPFKFAEYLELVDWTGKHIRQEHKAGIARGLPSILKRLGIRGDPWRGIMRPKGNLFGRAIGRIERLKYHAWNLGQFWIGGLYLARRLFGH